MDEGPDTRLRNAFAAEQQILNERHDDLQSLTDCWAAGEGVERGPFQERLALRWALGTSGISSWVEELAAVADDNALLARDVLGSRGWPTDISDLGTFSLAAIVAHADDDQPLRHTASLLLFDAVLRVGDHGRYLAHIVDRTQFRDHEGQIFGSLLVPETEGPRFLSEILNPDGVDERRARIGLPTIAADIERYKRGAVAGPFLIPIDSA